MTSETPPIELNSNILDQWANDPDGPVALHLTQFLKPIEGDNGVVFPPTYASESKGKSDYNIDTLSDGTKVALIDSVGSQANRMESIFMREPYSKLVPQIEIAFCQKEASQPPTVHSLLEASHRIADASVRCTPDLSDRTRAAIGKFRSENDLSEIAKIAPTSLLFGFWDSRDSGAKLSRLIQSEIRAWDIELLTRSAQFNPTTDYSHFIEADNQDTVAAGGFGHVPCTSQPGGVLVRGSIRRTITINLIALRRLQGDRTNCKALRQYILGLALIAATAPLDLFLRQGCLLVPDHGHPAQWECISRDGLRQEMSNWSEALFDKYARENRDAFFQNMPGPERYAFDAKLANSDLKRPGDEKAKKKGSQNKKKGGQNEA